MKRKPAARKTALPGFEVFDELPPPDPRNTVLVFPLDADGEPTEEALRQFAAIINAADQAEKGTSK